MRASIRAWESSFAGSWALFALAALPSSLTATWALVRLSPSLRPIDFAEWAFLTVACTVIGSISQLGLKPGYMQYVTDHGAETRYPGLRAAIVLMTVTGGGAGALLATVFVAAHGLRLWENIALLPWLILVMAAGNVTMMLHTDLRIRGKSSVIAAIALIQLPIFIGLLELCAFLMPTPLASLYAANALAGISFAVALIYLSGALSSKDLDIDFLKWAVRLGLPAMGALLFKYSCDLVVSGSFRWLTPELNAGLYGLANRLTEPLMALYIGAFQMAWGGFVYGWIKADPSSYQVARFAKKSYWFGMVAFPVGLLMGYLLFLISSVDQTYSDVAPLLLLCISRAAAFGLSSPVGYGQTLKRSYQKGFSIHVSEALLTATTIPLAMLLDQFWIAVLLAAFIPWITVWRLARYSKNIHLLTAKEHLNFVAFKAIKLPADRQ